MSQNEFEFLEPLKCHYCFNEFSNNVCGALKENGVIKCPICKNEFYYRKEVVVRYHTYELCGICQETDKKTMSFIKCKVCGETACLNHLSVERQGMISDDAFICDKCLNKE